MIIREKNRGSYISYKLSGTELTFRNKELVLDLTEFQHDYPAHVDISEDDKGRLVTGPAHRYMAELDIPARVYNVSAGEKDDLGFPLLYKTAEPLDMDEVTLTLWAVEV
jgi:hypothetical protein